MHPGKALAHSQRCSGEEEEDDEEDEEERVPWSLRYMPFSLLPAGETPLFFFFFLGGSFLLDGVEPHSKNIILTAFSSLFVKYVPMWTTTREKKNQERVQLSGGEGEKKKSQRQKSR